MSSSTMIDRIPEVLIRKFQIVSKVFLLKAALPGRGSVPTLGASTWKLIVGVNINNL